MLAGTAIATESATPASTARQLMDGGGRRVEMRGRVVEREVHALQKETDPRGLRGSVGSRKVPRPKTKTRRDSVAVSYFFFFEDFFFFAGIRITSFWPRNDGI
jgi:hypothetical protein